jgi:predicted DNA-binding transcriptional regulator
LENGADAPTALAAAVPAEARSVLNDALKEVEEARHEIRLYAFAMSLDQGLSVPELARQYGFSRQLAARYAREAQARRRLT